MREEEEEGRKGRARAREELSPSLFIPCLTEQSVGRQVWAADESTRSDPRRLAKWNQAGPRTQPDDAISTGVAGKSFGKKRKPRSLQTAHVQNLRYSGGIKKHGSLGSC